MWVAHSSTLFSFQENGTQSCWMFSTGTDWLVPFVCPFFALFLQYLHFSYTLCRICNCYWLLEFAVIQDIGMKERQSVCWWQYWSGCTTRVGWTDAPIRGRRFELHTRLLLFEQKRMSHSLKKKKKACCSVQPSGVTLRTAIDVVPSLSRIYGCISWSWNVWLLSDWLECIIIMHKSKCWRESCSSFKQGACCLC